MTLPLCPDQQGDSNEEEETSATATELSPLQSPEPGKLTQDLSTPPTPHSLFLAPFSKHVIKHVNMPHLPSFWWGGRASLHRLRKALEGYKTKMNYTDIVMITIVLYFHGRLPEKGRGEIDAENVRLASRSPAPRPQSQLLKANLDTLRRLNRLDH